MFGGEDLKVEIDGFKFREIPAKNNRQYYNIPPAWNGANLEGLSKTVIFILELKAGKHSINFIPKLGALIEEKPEIMEIKNPNDIKLNLQDQAQDGNRRPWIMLALVDLPLRILDASVKCDKREWDSDDVKLIIDGQIKKSEFGNWWEKNWFWQGRRLKGDIEERRFYLDLEKGNHYIEFWADRMPILNDIWLYLGIESDSNGRDDEKKEKQIKPKTADDIIELVSELYREIGKEVKFEKTPMPIKNFTKFDKEIEIAAKEFDVDPIILKATIAQESGFGNDIDHDDRYIGESGLMGLEALQSINTLEKLGYSFNFKNIADVIRAAAAYYNWVRERPTTFDFKDKDNPLKLYTQYRSDTKAKGIHSKGIPQFLFYYFYYKE
ncbi:hypothetical protein A2Y83_04125 [Candidatus Falkowbacteria bacterium RBG_13_39_14]|uniref:Transglycosylase SLT domain-containing protein n=1 Tax=Candidatus Falkowbacteria bacterium RBG_13_39_14 TaxID=1797985 RepID=A0A1F5S871_9BACT|nr:MAG: hypothetical protein A2Y83_04125 [Candidatus Falkowbacteria bacterium RBG_13_39_14]